MSDITLMPSSDEQLEILVKRLRKELDEHFSFAPKSDARLEEVLLGTLGMPNGRQQWQRLRDLRTTSESMQNAIEAAIVFRDIRPELSALMHHSDPQVQALMQGLQGYGQDHLVLTYGLGDFDSLVYGRHMTDDEVRATLRLAQRNMDASRGIDWDALDDYASKIFEKRVFIPASPASDSSDAHGVRYYGPGERAFLKDQPFGWYDVNGACYQLILPEEGEEEEDAYFLDTDGEPVEGHWLYLAR